MPVYANFIEQNNIEFGILLCSELYDNPLEGITYKESKEVSSVLDVVELDRRRENEDEEQCAAESHHDPLGYDEVLQAIRAIIWSNVNMKKKVPQPKFVHKEKVDSDDEKADDTDKLEAELSGFEQLLTEVMTFKETTASWSRNERLAYAEKFAGKFVKLNQNYCHKILNVVVLSFLVILFSDAFDNLLQHKTLDDHESSDSDS